MRISDAKPFTFGGMSFVMFQMKESYRRKLQLALSTSSLRRRRSTVTSSPTTNSFSIEFRTRNANGLLLYAEDVGGNFTILHVCSLVILFLLPLSISLFEWPIIYVCIFKAPIQVQSLSQPKLYIELSELSKSTCLLLCKTLSHDRTPRYEKLYCPSVDFLIGRTYSAYVNVFYI